MNSIDQNGVDPIARLVQVLTRLPGIGEKTATRLAFFIIKSGEEYARNMADALIDVGTQIQLCNLCQNFSGSALCRICANPRRQRDVICVVENVNDLIAIERSKEFAGRYHVLHGAISPLEGIGPDEIKLKELFTRLQGGEESFTKEIIIATNPSVDGEATALYIARMLIPLGIKVSRIASGMPIGGDFEYADPATISKALSGRHVLSA
jgi:recombination protein RecR